jgi:hypothetical protein
VSDEVELDPGSALLAMPGSDRVYDAVDAMPDVIARMTERDPPSSDPGIVTVCEAFEGPVFSAWREGRMVCSSNSWLAAAPAVRKRLAALLPTEDIELVLGQPKDYLRLDPDEDLFLLELRVDGRRRPWEEMKAAATLVDRLHLEHVVWRDRAGISTDEAIRSVGMSGSMSYKKDPLRLVYWLDIGDGSTAKHAALAMYLAPTPRMTYAELKFFRSFGILPRFNSVSAANDNVIATPRKAGSSPDQMGKLDQDLSKLSPRQQRLAKMRAAQVTLLRV